MKTVLFPAYTSGSGALSSLAGVCLPLGGPVLPVGGKTALAAALPRLEEAAAEHPGLTLLPSVWYGGDCTYKTIDEVAASAAAAGARVILGVGGGKAIDTAKAAADKLGLPFVSAPTISATCAAVTKLSVVYKDDGSFAEFYFCKTPPAHALIDTDIIAGAPYKFLRAGMGDAVAKFYEATFAMRGDYPPYESTLGQAVSASCLGPILEYGEKALADCKAGKATKSLEQVVLASVVSTGLVSLLVKEEYNGAVAHSLFYGLTLLPHIERDFLHGDVVAYGVLVQLALDKKEDDLYKVGRFFRAMGCPTKAADLALALSATALAPVLESAVGQPDMSHLPYRVTPAMLLDAMERVEKLP